MDLRAKIECILDTTISKARRNERRWNFAETKRDRSKIFAGNSASPSLAGGNDEAGNDFIKFEGEEPRTGGRNDRVLIQR